MQPISEIYFDIEPIFRGRSIAPFDRLMVAARDAAFENQPVDAVMATVQRPLDTTVHTVKSAPNSTQSAVRVEAEVIADIIDRATLQYRMIHTGTGGGDAYLDD